MEQTRKNLHRSEDSVIDLDLAMWDGHVAMIVGNGVQNRRHHAIASAIAICPFQANIRGGVTICVNTRWVDDHDDRVDLSPRGSK